MTPSPKCGLPYSFRSPRERPPLQPPNHPNQNPVPQAQDTQPGRPPTPRVGQARGGGLVAWSLVLLGRAAARAAGAEAGRVAGGKAAAARRRSGEFLRIQGLNGWGYS